MHPRHQHHSAYPQAIPKKSRVSAMGLPTLPHTFALKIMATLAAIVLALSFTLSLHAQDTAAGGTGPENALVPNTERTVLDPGETRWYTFLYDEGADGDNEPSDALAELEMDRPGSIDFEVWTEDDVRMWRNGEDFNPTGAGTAAFDPDSDDNRDRSRLTWVGSGAATTTWYIVVSNESDRAAAFSLSVTGPDVYFPEVGQAAVNPTSTPQTSEAAETATASATMTTTATNCAPSRQRMILLALRRLNSPPRAKLPTPNNRMPSTISDRTAARMNSGSLSSMAPSVWLPLT